MAPMRQLLPPHTGGGDLTRAYADCLCLTIFNRNITQVCLCILTTLGKNKHKIMSPQVVRDHGFCAYLMSMVARLTYMFTMPDRAPRLVVI
jgi:hypothetical protein